MDTQRETSAPLSEKRWCLPEEALEMYLEDDLVKSVLKKCKYMRKGAAYRWDDDDSIWEHRWYYKVRKLAPPRREEGPVADQA